MKKKTIFISCILIILIFFNTLGFPFWNTIKSYSIMYFYNLKVSKSMTLNKNGIKFHIPGGLKTPEDDWYPWMLHFDGSDYFSKYMGKNLSLNILYAFGSFDFFRGSSSFYDPSSPYYGAFYGGYAVFNNEPQNRPYGFYNDGRIHMDEIQKVPMFDQTNLVLPSVGCPHGQIIFKSNIEKIQYNQNYIGLDGWTIIDADIITNGPIHNPMDKKNIGYLQYGIPPKGLYEGFDYPQIHLKGRIYVKYMDELDGTFFLYVMAKDKETIDQCDKRFLSQSIIEKK